AGDAAVVVALARRAVRPLGVLGGAPPVAVDVLVHAVVRVRQPTGPGDTCEDEGHRREDDTSASHRLGTRACRRLATRPALRAASRGSSQVAARPPPIASSAAPAGR